MNNLFAIHGVESVIAIVKANSKEDTFDIFASNQIEDRNLNDFITEFASIEGLFGDFYKDTKDTLPIVIVIKVPKGCNN